ncbi:MULTISPECIES: acetyl-CoA carboxylase biotin carboxyl carrier protein [Holospora]|uniref:Biotin carboxyl carrier protein of acetyl-CoA carboxylase n=2 Tax=Holospora TaxID=44747 RepID=A0A061JID1_9PROT|nr:MULTISPECIES: biotin/lipoyl-containing protein [Holospora]ETZ05402.1 biotin carboxyl carrier protein of acetyl-CoA carboxylase [Holospora undulata HU1]GAJ46049.1 biotin carboxyl carrier protein of acetyl-CoA carboxylase [Holospora elegans E1]
MTASSNQELRFLDEATLSALKELIELLEKSSLSSVRYEQEISGVRHSVELSKRAKDSKFLGNIDPSSFCGPEPVKEQILSSSEGSVRQDTLYWVRSPLVGTAYVALKPGADPLVKAGDQVTVGTPLLIIEAMKVMNIIKSPVSGRVKEVRFADGHPVEYDEQLLGIDTQA